MEAPRVQHVTKASSDELLRKFAGMDSYYDSGNEASSARKSPAKRLKMIRKKNRSNNRGDEEQSPLKEDGNGSLSLRVVERKSLLPHQRGRRSGVLLRHLGISRSHHLRGCKNKSVLGALEKTWSKAVRGASKFFMEKHYNRHRLLINDMV